MLTKYKLFLDTGQGESSLVTKIQHILDTHQSRDAFIKLIRNYFLMGSNGYNLIMQAYDETLRDFGSKRRDSGDAFFGHPEAVAIILIVYMGVRDPNLVAAAILHDNVEDLSHLGWTHDRVLRTYNPTIANIIWWMTKAKVIEYDGDKVRRDAAYHERLLFAPIVVINNKID
jgi:(p)ppGpp synthase/HD superfamily hydrolase